MIEIDLPAGYLTDRCNAIRSGKEPGLKGSVRACRVPPARGRADRLNCTGCRHSRQAGLPHVPWRDNEACAGSLCIYSHNTPTTLNGTGGHRDLTRLGFMFLTDATAYAVAVTMTSSMVVTQYRQG